MRKQLQDLAAAIKQTAEYQNMVAARRKLLASPQLKSRLLGFEREHSRILGAAEQGIEARLEKLYASHQDFLNHEDVKHYTKATQRYQEMISSEMRYLNKLLDVTQAL